jgi:2-polyprenyl-6-hydroxyphenyl methylase/3-demethylubiquinone-9 3-methyltransferase
MASPIMLRAFIFSRRQLIARRVHVSAYYSRKLSAVRLKQVYDIAPPRVKNYLDAELNHVLEKIRPADLVLELGCGYGRVLPRLAEKAGRVIGIDTSLPSLALAQEALATLSNCSLSRMDASTLGFHDQTFDCVVCIQNGISAFHVDQRTLITESVRVARPGGIVLFSSYSNKFWKHRLEWFELQSKSGLLGEIDYERTRNGVITCRDGFTATTVDAGNFRELTANLNADVRIVEIDESSLFCEIAPIRSVR